MSHQCQTLVIHCIDFRLGKTIKKYLEGQNLLGDCDIVSVAGAAKNIASPENDSEREFLMKQIDISKKLHNINEVILINHSDCGAYGGSSAFNSNTEEKERHFQDMERATNIIREKYHDLKIKKMLADIDDSGDVTFVDG